MLIAYIASAAVFVTCVIFAARCNSYPLFVVGMLPFLITGFVGGANTAVHAAQAYTAGVRTTLERDYGATVSPASADKVPYENATRSRGQVLLTTPSGKKLCTIETGTGGPSDLSVICGTTELPKLTAPSPTGTRP